MEKSSFDAQLIFLTFCLLIYKGSKYLILLHISMLCYNFFAREGDK